MDNLEMKEIESAIEAILFASGEPIQADRICVAMEMDRPTVELVLKRLADHYSYERRGIRLIRMEDSYQLCSAPDYADQVRKALELRKSAKLSQPALEVLTIIAYYQPTTRAYVDQIRGVDSSYTVSALLNKKLITEDGRLNAPGRPILYRTTPDFLRTFGLESLDELPEMEKVQFSTAAEDGGEATGSGQQAAGDRAVGAAIGRPPEAEASDQPAEEAKAE